MRFNFRCSHKPKGATRDYASELLTNKFAGIR